MTNGECIQVEQGQYARIHNEILNALATARFSGSEYRCLMFLFRMTYGWQKKEDAISTSQWAEGVGIEVEKRHNVWLTLQTLLKKNVIYARDNGNNRPKTWGFNKYIESWDASLFPQTVMLWHNSAVIEEDNSFDAAVMPQHNETVMPQHNHKRKKENNTTNVVSDEPTPSPPLAEQFHALIGELRQTKNKAAVLRQVYVLCFGEDGAPDYGYLGKTARTLGGAGHLAQRMFELVARPPNGDVLAYILGEHRNKHNRSNGYGKDSPTQNSSWAELENATPDYMRQ